MLALGGFFLAWLWLRPTEVSAPRTDSTDEKGPQTPTGN
jgi:hypothetical protein